MRAWDTGLFTCAYIGHIKGMYNYSCPLHARLYQKMGMYVEIYMHFICGQVFSMYDKKLGFFSLGGWVEDRACMSHVCYIVNSLLLYYTCRMYIFNDPCRHLWIHALYMQACIGHIYLNMYALYMWACIGHTQVSIQ